MINARLEASDVIEDFKQKARRFPKACNAAINDMASQTKTYISKQIREEYNIKASDLNKNFVVKRSTWQNLRAELEATGKGISISRYGAKRTSKAISFGNYKRFAIQAKIKKVGPKKIIPGAFQMKSTFGKRKSSERLPIQKVYGPGPATMFNNKMQDKAILFIDGKFPLILERQINYFYS